MKVTQGISLVKVADYLAQFLKDKNVTCVFELSGGMITYLLDAISRIETIKIVSMHHEQSAAFAADGVGRTSGVPGVAMATSGPGATNLLTGIGSCYFDSVPAIFITGQVNTHETKGEKRIRQQGFQETDIVSMAKPITKLAISVTKAQDLPQILEEAFVLSTSGRPGPVLIDIPMNFQRESIEVPQQLQSQVKKNQNINYNNIYQEISKAKRPLIVAGRGVSAAKAEEAFRNMLHKINIPVCLTLLGLDLLDYENPNRIGFLGAYGNRWVNKAVGESDLLLVLGARLDIRQTGADTQFFQNRKIIQVDCESGEINNRIKGCSPIVEDLDIFIRTFSQFLADKEPIVKSDWLNVIRENEELYPDTNELKNVKRVHPNSFIKALSLKLKTKFITADVGSHQMWAAQSLRIKKGQKFLTSGGMGAMGYALPAAIGVTIGSGQPSLVIVGDGCMQLNIQELQTIVRNKLPVKIVVLNNESLGMIRQFQDSYFDSRYQSTVWGYSAPDFSKVAQAYGIDSRQISSMDEVDQAIAWLSDENKLDQPQLLEVLVDPKANAYPKIAFGRPLNEMEPEFKPKEVEST